VEKRIGSTSTNSGGNVKKGKEENLVAETMSNKSGTKSLVLSEKEGK